MRGFVPLLAFIALIAVLALSILRGNSDQLSYNLLEKPVPDYELTELYDENRNLGPTDITGEITLVNLFGTWCAPCKVEHPKWMEIAEQDRVRVVGLNWRDPRDRAKAWLAQLGDPYDFVIYDRLGELVIAMGATGAPETYVIDQNGLIRYKHVGMVTDQVWDQTLWPLIQELEAEK